MTELEELEDIFRRLENIDPFGVEPDFSSLKYMLNGVASLEANIIDTVLTH